MDALSIAQMEDRPRYAVGDTVRIVYEPVDSCFYWASGMDKLCGVETTISEVFFDRDYETEAYRVDADPGWVWSWNCFEHEEMEEEVQEEIDEEEFMGLLNL